MATNQITVGPSVFLMDEITQFYYFTKLKKTNSHSFLQKDQNCLEKRYAVDPFKRLFN